MQEQDIVQRLTTGALAGLAATGPMTAFMEAAFQALPRREQYPLPPREITARAGAQAGVWHKLSESERQTATLVAHHSYGAVAGALYGLVNPQLPLPPALRGVSYGLTIWAGNYLGLLPAVGLFPPATEEPARRNALMIAAHVVWGLSLGLLTEAASKPASRTRPVQADAPEQRTGEAEASSFEGHRPVNRLREWNY